MYWFFRRNPTAYDDDWEDQPGQSALHQWGLGFLIAGSLLAYGIWIIASRDAEFGNGGESMILTGKTAIAYGIAVISAGLFAHFHYFWGNIYNQVWWAVLGKIVAAMAFIAGLGYLIVSVFTQGWS